jgi:hypothetical protein
VVIDKDAVLLGLTMAVVDPGLNWKIGITGANGFLIGTIDTGPKQAGQIAREWKPPFPARMAGGIKIISSGTPGDAYLWIWFTYDPAQQPAVYRSEHKWP